MGGDFAQGRFEAGLLIGVYVGFGQRDLIYDALFIGRATPQLRGFFGGHQGCDQHAAKGQQGER